MTSISVPPSRTSNASTVLDELNGAFNKIEFAHQQGLDFLSGHTSSLAFDILKANKLINSLRVDNNEFLKAWRHATIEIHPKYKEPCVMYFPDFEALDSFLKMSKISCAPERFAAASSYSTINNSGRIEEIFYVGDGAADFIIEPLQRLRDLKKLMLFREYSYCAEIAKLLQLEELAFSPLPESEANIPEHIKRQSQKSGHHQTESATKNTEVRFVDLLPLSQMTKLKNLTVGDPTYSCTYSLLSGLDPIFALNLLQSLTLNHAIIDRCPGKDILSQMPTLEKIALVDCDVRDISFLDYTPSLTELDLSQSFLSFSTVNYPPRLQKLRLFASKTEHLAELLKPLLELTSLKTVVLDLLNHNTKYLRPFNDEENELITILRFKGVEVSATLT